MKDNDFRTRSEAAGSPRTWFSWRAMALGALLLGATVAYERLAQQLPRASLGASGHSSRSKHHRWKAEARTLLAEICYLLEPEPGSAPAPAFVPPQATPSQIVLSPSGQTARFARHSPEPERSPRRLYDSFEDSPGV